MRVAVIGQGLVFMPLSSFDVGVVTTAHTGVNCSLWKNVHAVAIDVSSAVHTGWPKFL